jgi:hypothetical protein
VTNHEERGRVPRVRAGRLVGEFALFAGIVNLVTILVWSQSSRSSSLKSALWAAAFTLAASVLLLISAGVVRYLEQAFVFEVTDPPNNTEQGSRAWLDRNREMYYGCIAVIIASLGATVVFTGGPARSPFAQILIGSFVLGQILSPNARTVWFLLVTGCITVIACQLIHALGEKYWWHAEFVGLSVPAATYIAPAVLTAIASTFVNLASVRSRQALAANALSELPNRTDNGKQDTELEPPRP